MQRDNYQHVNQYIATAEIMTHYMYLAQHLNAKMSVSADNTVWRESILSYNYQKHIDAAEELVHLWASTRDFSTYIVHACIRGDNSQIFLKFNYCYAKTFKTVKIQLRHLLAKITYFLRSILGPNISLFSI